MAESPGIRSSIACVCLDVAAKVGANKARHVSFPLNGEVGVSLLPNDTLGAFPGGGVPQRMKANPKNSSTADMIRLLHSSPWCKYSTTRAAQVALSTIVLHLTPEQNQALDIFDGRADVLAGCAPVIVNERGLLRGASDGHELECYMLRRTMSGAIQCVYVSEGKLKSSPLSQQVSLLEAVSSSGAIVSRGDLVCLFNNSCMPRGACSLLFSVLATVPVWDEQVQSMLVKRQEFFLQQYATPVRIIANDLVAASNVNMRSSSKRTDKANGLPDYTPRQELPPGSILANILSRRPGLQPPGCVAVPPTSTAACLQAFTACIVEAARLTLGLRTVDGQVTAKHVHARLQQVQQQLCQDESSLASSGAHAAAAAGLPQFEATMVPPPRVQASAQRLSALPPAGASAVPLSASSHFSTAAAHAAPTFDKLATSAVQRQRVSLPTPPGGGPMAFPLRLQAGQTATAQPSELCHIRVRLQKKEQCWTAVPSSKCGPIDGNSPGSAVPLGVSSSPKPMPLQLRHPADCPDLQGEHPLPLQIDTPSFDTIGGAKRSRDGQVTPAGPSDAAPAPAPAQAAQASLRRVAMSEQQLAAVFRAAKQTATSQWPSTAALTPGGTFSSYPSHFASSAGYALKALPAHTGAAGRSARDFMRPTRPGQELDPV